MTRVMAVGIYGVAEIEFDDLSGNDLSVKLKGLAYWDFSDVVALVQAKEASEVQKICGPYKKSLMSNGSVNDRD